MLGRVCLEESMFKKRVPYKTVCNWSRIRLGLDGGKWPKLMVFFVDDHRVQDTELADWAGNYLHPNDCPIPDLVTSLLGLDLVGYTFRPGRGFIFEGSGWQVFARRWKRGYTEIYFLSGNPQDHKEEFDPIFGSEPWEEVQEIFLDVRAG